MMNPLSLAAVMLLVATPAVAEERNFPVSAFDRLDLRGSADVDVRKGAALSVVATGEAEDIDRLDIRVDGGQLVIGTKPGKWNWSSRKGVRVIVTTPGLAAATLSGSGNVAVDRIDGGFNGTISGSGNMRLPSVNSPTFGLLISGSGEVSAAGQCGDGKIHVSGSGNVEAASLRCTTMRVTVSGSGNVDAMATGTADLSISGSGNIKLAGGARCTTRTSGSGTVRCG